MLTEFFYRLLLGLTTGVEGSYAFNPSSPVNISTSNSAEDFSPDFLGS